MVNCFAGQHNAHVMPAVLFTSDCMAGLQCRRRSGLRVRPLLRTALSKPQQPAQPKTHSKKQNRQHQQTVKQQQPQQASDAQVLRQQNTQSVPEQEQQTSSSDRLESAVTESDGKSQQPTAAQDHTDASEQSDASLSDGIHDGIGKKAQKTISKRQKGRKTKKDYAAWAGATAETRAAAVAQLQGNPDAADAQAPKEHPVPGKQGELCLNTCRRYRNRLLGLQS